MNAAGRDKLDAADDLIEAAIVLLDEARDIIERVRDEEEDKFFSLPEGLQASERGQAIETAADALTVAMNDFDKIDFTEVREQIDLAREGG